MPGRNVIKNYKKDSYYHIYNRGVNKRSIFRSIKDVDRFLKYLHEGATRFRINLIKHGVSSNHFHIALKQKKDRDIEKLMRSVATRYALYFNFKYDRIGRVYQGPYRARLIKDENDLSNVLEYIENHKLQGSEVSDEFFYVN